MLMPGELVIDSFAGGGGASTGIEEALGRPVDIAINHSPAAIAMHQANHPETKHFCENIWEVDPKEACGSNKVGLAWFSPDCTHFSKAKGTKPVKSHIRGLAWVVTNWAINVKPRVIILENVEEFQTWGSIKDGRPDPAHKGEIFREWLYKLERLGYNIEFKTLVAADYGTPTTRKRLFIIARLDNAELRWPEPTHGKGRPVGWKPASGIIDWSIPCPSIFTRKRALAEATMKRIAAGIERYVLKAANPFIIPLTHQGDARTYDIDDPLRTVTGAHRGEFALIEPFVIRHGHYSTITDAGLREGCGPFRGQPLKNPLGTVCATNDKHLVCPIVVSHYGNSVGRAIDEPLPTVTAGGGGHQGIIAPFMMKYYGGVVGHRLDNRPIGTVTAWDHHALTAAFLAKWYGTSTGQSCEQPVPTITGGGGHIGLVTVHGQQYQIVDIGMRMLQPRELFAAQGFPDDYDITPEFRGKPLTKTAQISLAGNSVCPQVARALVEANARS